MTNRWYTNLVEQDLRKEAINWKDVGKGLGIGGMLGALPATIGLLTGPHNMPQTSQPEQTKQVETVAPEQKPQEQPKQQVKPQPRQNVAVSIKEVQDFTAPWEGYREKAYKDSEGFWTIGIGFNMDQPGAEKELKAIGADKAKLISGQQSLSKEQISKLFEKYAKIAIADAHKWIPNLDSQPKQVQLICIDMSFNMGGSIASKFPDTGKLITSKQYAKAASLMEKSKWYGQVGNRSRNHVQVMKELGNQATKAP
jgi:GH24 family phage-related lysozyme (muramidase)